MVLNQKVTKYIESNKKSKGVVGGKWAQYLQSSTDCS
jgi:hypothetical protein